jgi:hypothetical protein
MSADYQLVRLANGEQTLFSAAYGEKMHPGLGPAAEADLLYVRQLDICARLQAEPDEFVIWDVGLGGAANAIATLRATMDCAARLRLISFDDTAEPLAFALSHAAELRYPVGYEARLAQLLRQGEVRFQNGRLAVAWQFHRADFPGLMQARGSNVPGGLPAPHAIYYDGFSPARNPAMWTLPVFQNLFALLDPARPCALTTYSRSTLVRATLLLAGFCVGVGRATGTKEETTIAANRRELIAEPLDQRWLARACRSDSAEPLRAAVYSRSALTPETRAALLAHRQFIAGKVSADGSGV